MMKYYWIYITTSDKAEAEKIGAALVKQKLAACVNILDGMQSMYRWKGKVEKDQETVLIAKTKAALVDELITEVKRQHSYDCPCIIALPIEQGAPEYLQWIDAETK